MKPSLSEVRNRLPDPWPTSLLPDIRRVRDKRAHSLVVLDDDPTGTQTVHDTPVLTEWSVSRLEKILAARTPVFYILTNSRSLGPEAAWARISEIAG
ncbi:MAG: four-carbon acid sugar kinase family protein, partial [Verrucomicrobiota bacterium]